jgi:hypothetical protein
VVVLNHERIRGLKDLSRGGPESRTFPSKVTQGLHPAPSLTKPVRIQGHLSRGGSESRAFPSRVTRVLRGRLHLRAQPSQEHLHGLRERLHLRPPPNEEQVQGLQATPG